MRAKIGALVAAAAAAIAAAGAATWAKGRRDEELDLEVPEATTTESAQETDEGEAAATPTSAAYHAPAADDLTAIKGLGKVKAAKLVEAGVTSYAQIAAWTDDDIAEVGLKVNTSPGQIKREEWVGQAATLAQQ